MCRKLIYAISFVLVLGLAADMVSGLEIKINFQEEYLAIKGVRTTTPVEVPQGYLPDYGEEFADRGNGYSYGWDANMVWSTRTRSYSSDQRYNTLIEMGTATWEIAVPSGSYVVFLSCGDPSYDDHISTHDVEGVIVVDPDGRTEFNEYTVTVTVTDGRLTIKPGPSALKCPIMFLHITRVPVFKAYGPDPVDGATHSDTTVSLSWTPGDAAVSHNVYLGDNFDDVSNGTGDTFRGNQTETSFIAGTTGQPYPDGLIPGTTYYWRVDEVNDAHPDRLWRGDVWSFKVPTQTAYAPDPPDGATFVDLDVTLSWNAGLGATSHLMYFGTVKDNVEKATTTSPEYIDSDPNTSFSPGILVRAKTYYWRIDEFDGVTTHQGDVWSFTTIPNVPITDTSLLCWWKFDADGGSDTYAIDYSGHDHHGIIHGASLELNGRVGEALNFGGDGDYVVDEDAEEYLNTFNAITVCMWIKSDQVGTERGFINCAEPDGRDEFVSMRYDIQGSAGGGANIIKMGLRSTPPEEYYKNYLESSSYVQTTGWQHVAMTWTGGEVIKFYVNGVRNTPTRTSDPCVPSTITGCTKLIIGKGCRDTGGATNGWNGLIDDVRIYNKVLTEDEIKQAMRGEPNFAWNESPANGSTPDLHRALPLSWLPGDLAAQHDVYFGTDRDAVADANTSDTTGVYRPRQAATSYTPPEGVEWGRGPYYWRIDEYNTDGTITKGRLWQFTVADFILVDDIEDYNDNTPKRIFETWKDGYGYTIYKDGNPVGTNCGNGTGSAVGHTQTPFAETVIVNLGSGVQSMPFYYDNSATGYNICNQLITKYYSEAKRALDYPRDWTEQDVKALTLWFRGYAPGFKEGPAGTYTITASGADIAGTADEFRYIWKKLSGAGSISAKVLSVQNTHEWAKAGVMIRRGLDPAYQFAAVYITPGNGCRFQARLSYGADYASDADAVTPEQKEIKAPYWIKLVRDSSNNFTGYYSGDGINWQLIPWSPGTILMPSSVYIGLALTSHNVNAVCKAQFSDVKTTGSVSPATWTNEVIGSTIMRTNTPEPMYVAIANKTGSPAIVYHDDPNAAQIDTWTQWNIDLKDFTNKGINLADVNSIALGLGSRNSTQAGGSGLMYFDDIRLYRSRCVPEKLTLSQADFNSDCVVDLRDLQVMAGDWLTNGPDADLNSDGTVGFKDYAVLVDQWLEEVAWP
jgi:hypothetical protein